MVDTKLEQDSSLDGVEIEKILPLKIKLRYAFVRKMVISVILAVAISGLMSKTGKTL